MARGDHNRSNSSHHETNNQSNHGFGRTNKENKSTRHKKQTGRRPSERQEPTASIDSDRNTGKPEQGSTSRRHEERTFDIIVDSVPYTVRVVPFTFNGELRYTVSFNGSSEYVFTWDSEIGQLRAINDDSSVLPDNLETAISQKLQSKA